jgi:hypothetical protein
MEKRQRFTAEFKREAVRLLKQADKPAAVIARELGIPRNRIYKVVGTEVVNPAGGCRDSYGRPCRRLTRGDDGGVKVGLGFSGVFPCPVDRASSCPVSRCTSGSAA